MRKSINRMLDRVEGERFRRIILSIILAYSDLFRKLTDTQMQELDRRFDSLKRVGEVWRPFRESLTFVDRRLFKRSLIHQNLSEHVIWR